MTDLAPSSTGATANTAAGGQSGFDFTTLLNTLLSGAGAYTGLNAANNNDKNISNLVSQLTTKAPPASATANGGTSTFNNGALTLDNGNSSSIQDLFKNNATQNLTSANSLNPAVTNAAQGVTSATGNSYNDVYNSTLAAIRGQLADTQTKTWNNLASNLFSTGNLGSTGGAQQSQAFFQAAGNNDLAAQLAAQQSATNARTSDINAATTNFNVQNAAQSSQVQQALQNLSGSNAIDQNTLSMIQSALQGSIGQTNANNAGAGSAAALLSKTPDTSAQSLLASLLSKASGGSSGTGLLGSLSNGVDSLLGGSGNANTDITTWLKGLLGGGDTSGLNAGGDAAAAGGLTGLGSASDALGGIDGPLATSGNSSSGSGTDVGTIASGAGTAAKGTDLIGSLFGDSAGISAAGDALAAQGLNGLGSAADAIGSIDGPLSTTGSTVGSTAANAGQALGGGASADTGAMSGASAALLAGAAYTGAKIIGDITDTKPGAQLNFGDIKPNSGVDITMQIPGVNSNLVGSPTAGVAYGLGNQNTQGSGYWYYKDPSSKSGWNIDKTGALADAAQMAPLAMQALLGPKDANGNWTFNGDILGPGTGNTQGGYNFGGSLVVPNSSSNTTVTVSPDGVITQKSGYGPYSNTITNTALSDAYANRGGKASGLSLPEWIQQLANVSKAKSGYVNGTPGG